MLRHPIDRALSVYSFARKDRTQPDHRVASAGDFGHYVRWALDSQDGGVVIKNYQVIHLSSASFRHGDIRKASATRKDLHQAMEVLSTFGVFGLVNQFAKSCDLFMRYYRDAFPELRLFETRVNAGQPNPTDETDAIAQARSALGPALFQRLVDANELDLTLYERATAIFKLL